MSEWSEQGRENDDRTPAANESDGGPGSHTEQGSGGSVNDPASGGVPEQADEES
jgi:hypothetical protein